MEMIDNGGGSFMLPEKNQQSSNSKEISVAALAAAEHSKALIQAKFLVALNRPRDVERSRLNILAACKRPRFAECAQYSKPQAGKKIKGPSIRYADEAVKIFGNIDTTHTVVYEDDELRQVLVNVTDLETNLSKSQTVSIKKTVERKKLKDGQNCLASRINSFGEKIYILPATDDEVNNKEGNLCAKARRNLELQMIPQDIIDESMDAIENTKRAGAAKDIAAERRKIFDAFHSLGIYPKDLSQYLGHDVEQITPEEISDLRTVFHSLKEGEAKWNDFIKDIIPLQEDNPNAAKNQKSKHKAQDPAPENHPEVDDKAFFDAIATIEDVYQANTERIDTLMKNRGMSSWDSTDKSCLTREQTAAVIEIAELFK